MVSFKVIALSQFRERILLLGNLHSHRKGYHTNCESDSTVDLIAKQQPAGPRTGVELKYSRIDQRDPKCS